MANNMKNRRARGQCATCTNKSERFYCDACRVKNNAKVREWRFKDFMKRESKRPCDGK
jgi:hypothetical protein